ncbi:hypothetical protein K2X89_02045, partial [Myxococcota bacterium]|nr:hypothetical protein [Myxococcota bacterium]
AANVMRRIRAGEAEPGFFERIQRVIGGALEPSFVLPASAVAVAALVFAVLQNGGPLSSSLAVGDSAPTAAGARGVIEPEVAFRAESDEAVAVVEPEVDRAFGAAAAELAGAAPDAFGADSARAADSEPGFADASAPDELFAEARPQARASEDGEPRAASPNWGSPSRRMSAAPSAGNGAYFGDSSLAQGLASEVAGPATGFAHRLPADAANAVPVTLSRRMTPDAFAAQAGSGEDPRDAWLARALEHPAEFAGYIARQNLAEQELWVERLTERARSRGLLGELIEALRSAGDEKATWLAEDFAAQATEDSAGEPRPDRAE